jgi:hypothetical protein
MSERLQNALLSFLIGMLGALLGIFVLLFFPTWRDPFLTFFLLLASCGVSLAIFASVAETTTYLHVLVIAVSAGTFLFYYVLFSA